MRKTKKHTLIIGTLILTATGLLSRLIGFFYRIYLARLFGAEGMGVYQLLSPVLAISFSLTAAGYQTAISKLVAEQTAIKGRNSYRPLLAGLGISLPLSVLCSIIIWFFSDFIGIRLLMEERTVNMLRILSVSIPLSAIHSCINGYFYGKKKTVFPALAQLCEQLARVGCVYIVAGNILRRGETPSVDVAVWGLAVGELFSVTITLLLVFLCYAKELTGRSPSSRLPSPSFYHGILALALPLTANRIVLNLLQSVESVSIPASLKLYGYDNATALSIYGVLTGMAMPLIFFPNALTGSVSVLLLPTISESYALGDIDAVKRATRRTIEYCGTLGLCCMGFFCLFGRYLGTRLFDSPMAGEFITILGFICPFIYLDITLSSILQGLGLAGRIFVINTFCLLIRLVFVFRIVPLYGITGYLGGLFLSQLLQCILYLICLRGFHRHKK